MDHLCSDTELSINCVEAFVVDTSVDHGTNGDTNGKDVNGACKKGNSPCDSRSQEFTTVPPPCKKTLAMTDLSQDTRVGTLTQSQQLNKNKETLLPCSATTDKQCAMRRVARQNMCRAKHMASNTVTINKQFMSPPCAPRQKKTYGYMTLHATSKREHEHKKVRGRKTTDW